jgi:serine/threonine protein kinase
MAKTRAQKIETLFHLALPLKGASRERFLADACKEDYTMYLEIISLLAHHQVEDELLEGFAIPTLVNARELEEPVFKQGELVGSHYEIISHLGKGGMGEVYLARDQRLGRKVAVKILPRYLADRPAFIDRLRREALAASGLNHPNILTIYEFGEHGVLHYIVSEFVEGSSLREHIGRLSISEALDYAKQIGRALAEAHAAGIVHRDIKPENIMVRPDGFIKVLDFGLAKPDGPQSDAGKSLFERLANAGTNTVPGLLLGTVNYMSPEQARGEPVDRRTDIWSWGVVLYEMLHGKRPFEAFPGQDQQPASNDKQLSRVLTRALAKSAGDRYQSMEDALADLARAGAAGHKLSFNLKQITAKISGADTKAVLRWCMALVLLVLVGAIAFLAYRHINSAPLHVESMSPLTTSGTVTQAAISPDGNYVAYATTEDTGQALWIRPAKSSREGETKRLSDTSADFTGITFGRDGQSIYFVVRQDEVGKLYRLTLPVGVPKMILDDVDSPASFSPDGQQFAFLRTDSRTHQTALMVKGLEVGTETNLATFTAPDYFWTAPVWSPDGSSLAFGILNDSSTGRPTNLRIMSITVNDRQQHVVGPEPWYSVFRPIWVKGGRSLLLSANGDHSNVAELLEMSWPKGETSVVRFDAGILNRSNFGDLDATADQSRFVAIQYVRRSNPWIVPLAHPLSARQVPGPDGRFYGVAWTSAGDLISQTDVGGHPDLWSISSVTGELKPLTHDDSVEEDPSTSPDGRYLVYSSNRGGAFHLWRSNADGSDPVRLTADDSREEDARITSDGKSVIFTSIKSGYPALWSVSIQGGEPVQLTRRSARRASISPDGSLIVCDYVEKPLDGWTTAILQAATGKPVRIFANIPAGDSAIPVQWGRDGKGLLFVKTERGVSNIWMQPVDGGLARQMTHFMTDKIFAFAQSFDGGFLACIRGTLTSDVVMVQMAR